MDTPEIELDTPEASEVPFRGIVACTTEGCVNQGIPIEVLTTGMVMCGPCGFLIEEVERV